MRRARLGLAMAAAALLSAFALAACGGSDNSSQDEDQITAVITRAATSGDPAACTDSQTAKFTQQTSGDPGQSADAAVKSCEQDAAQTAAEKVDVTDVQVDGDTATAKAKATGSVFGGQTLDLGLVKEGGKWKLDEFKGFESFDKAAMVASFKQELLKDPTVSPQAADCVTQQFQAASDQDIEGFFTGTNQNAEQQLFAPCAKYFQGG